MCKCMNPCLCIPSGFACFLVALCDIFFGALTLYFSVQSFENFDSAKAHLKETKTNDDVFWFGIISLPAIATTGIWSGMKLLASLCMKSEESNHILKFTVFFIAEVIGFVAPFYIFDDYVPKIKQITSFSSDPNHFIVFHLLEVNPVTIFLFIYQIHSFWVVHRHQLLKKEAALIKRVVKYSGSKVVPEVVKPIDSFNIITEVKPNKASVPKQTTLSVQKSLYPDLNELRLDVLPSPLCAITSNSSDSEDESQIVETSPLRLQRPSKQASKFEQLKQRCAKTKTLYIDEDFPANKASIGSGKQFVWKRPHEIRKDARFFTDGVSRFDAQQGALGNCWFVAALGNLTLHEDLFKQVVPHDNEWAESGDYLGICHFRFWVDGEWKEVIVDDRLPTSNGELVFLTSRDCNEFWSPLIEKAYAKLFGSYYKLSGNQIGRAMKDFTGGTVTTHRIEEFYRNYDKMFKLIDGALMNKKMVGCCISIQPHIDNGLFARHAYSVTHTSKIQLTNGSKVSALRIRNPWGNETEWNGKFSDSHPIWESVDKKTKKELQLIFRGDGEFWVPLDDFVKYFSYFEICHLP